MPNVEAEWRTGAGADELAGKTVIEHRPLHSWRKRQFTCVGMTNHRDSDWSPVLAMRSGFGDGDGSTEQHDKYLCRNTQPCVK